MSDTFSAGGDRGRGLTMATMETLLTRLDTLQWEANRLEVENRRLREEHPEESRVLTLEAELERSKNDTRFRNPFQYGYWKKNGTRALRVPGLVP